MAARAAGLQDRGRGEDEKRQACDFHWLLPKCVCTRPQCRILVPAGKARFVPARFVQEMGLRIALSR
jgi:hypothetical protein